MSLACGFTMAKLATAAHPGSDGDQGVRGGKGGGLDRVASPAEHARGHPHQRADRTTYLPLDDGPGPDNVRLIR